MTWLASQINEILPSSPETLVPDAFGTRIYRASSLWGRIWTFFWEIIHLFDTEDTWKEKTFLQVIQMTHQLWTEKCEELQAALLIMDQFIINYINDKSQDSEANEVGQAWSFLIENKSFIKSLSKINEVFKAILGDEAENNVEELIQQTESITSFIEVERKIKIPYPTSALVKLSLKEILSKHECEQMTQFVEAICESYSQQDANEKIMFREFHFGLKFLLEKKNIQWDRLSIVEWMLHKALLDKNCHLYLEKDPLHHPSKKLVVGDQILSHKSPEEDHHLVFSMNQDRVLVVSPCNASSLGLEYQATSEANWGLPLANALCVREDWAIYERLDNELNSKRIHSLKQWIKSIVKSDCMPKNLSPSMIYFDKTDQLKFLKLVPKKKLNWDVVNDCLKSILGTTHHQLYWELREHTGLNKHKTARYYEVVMISALSEVTLPKMTQKAEQIRDQVQACFNRCLQRSQTDIKNELKRELTHLVLSRRHLDLTPEEEQAIVNSILLQMQKNAKSPLRRVIRLIGM